MDHDQIRLALAGYLDHSLEPKERAVIEEHLKTCSSCTASLKELRDILDQARQMDKVDSPPWLTQKVMARVREKAEKKERAAFGFFHGFRFPIESIGVVVLALTALLIYPHLRPEDPLSEKVQPGAPPIGSPKERPSMDDTTSPAPSPSDGVRKTPSNPPAGIKSVPPQSSHESLSSGVEGAGKRGAGAVHDRSADTVAQESGSSGKQLLIRIRTRSGSFKEVEEAIKRSGGTVISTDKQSETWVMTFQIDESKHAELLSSLRRFGKTDERIMAIDGREGREIRMSSPKAAVGC